MDENGTDLRELAEVYSEETCKTNKQILDHFHSRMEFENLASFTARYEEVEAGLVDVKDAEKDYSSPFVHNSEDLVLWLGDHSMKKNNLYNDPQFKHETFSKVWDPYEMDVSQLPKMYQTYAQNFIQFDEATDQFKKEAKKIDTQNYFNTYKSKDEDAWKVKYEDDLRRKI